MDEAVPVQSGALLGESVLADIGVTELDLLEDLVLISDFLGLDEEVDLGVVLFVAVLVAEEGVESF